MADLSDLQAEANSLIAEYGRQVKLRRRSVGLENTLKPWLGPAATSYSEQTVYMVFAEDVKAYFSNTQVQRGDKAAILASTALAGAAPSAKDQVIDGGIAYTIIEVSEVKPGSQSVVYQLLLRM